MRMKKLEHIHSKDPKVKDMVDFYILLKLIYNADFKTKEEYRKNVTLVTKDKEINIAMLKDYVNIVKYYVNYIDELTQ